MKWSGTSFRHKELPRNILSFYGYSCFIFTNPYLTLFVVLITITLDIRLGAADGINVPDAELIPVSTTEDVIRLMTLGHKNRAVGSTAMNDRSSRSHRFHPTFSYYNCNQRLSYFLTYNERVQAIYRQGNQIKRNPRAHGPKQLKYNIYILTLPLKLEHRC